MKFIGVLKLQGALLFGIDSLLINDARIQFKNLFIAGCVFYRWEGMTVQTLPLQRFFSNPTISETSLKMYYYI